MMLNRLGQALLAVVCRHDAILRSQQIAQVIVQRLIIFDY
jgi:hypothetical protein